MPVTYTLNYFSNPAGASPGYTQAAGIDDARDTVGAYNNAAFLDRNGTFTNIQPPAAPTSRTSSFAEDIANNGLIAGYYITYSDNPNGGLISQEHAFVALNGSYTAVDDPSATTSSDAVQRGTILNGIDEAGDAVGAYYSSAQGAIKAFLYSGGGYKDIAPSGTIGGIAYDINNVGQIVGVWTDGATQQQTSYLRSKDGTFTVIADPAAMAGTTRVQGINDAGQIVGFYTSSTSHITAFMYYNGVFQDVGPADTFAYKINNNGDIVGTSKSISYVAVPSSPSANHKFEFSFTYSDGSSYAGSVVDDGSKGYTVGKTIPSSNGAFKITKDDGGSSLAAGTVSVTSYYDVTSNMTYTPHATSQNQADGTSGLGSEYDYTTGARGNQYFGQGGAYEAKQGGISRVSHDLIGAGRSDVLFRNATSGDFGYLTTTASGAAGTYVGLGASNAAYAIVGTGDFAGAGHAGILFRNASTGDLGYVEPANDGYHALGGSSTGYGVRGVGDFDGNGSADVLFRNDVSGDIGYLTVSSTGSAGAYVSLGASNTGYAVAGIGDYNGDGAGDILFRSAASGDMGYLATSGGARSTYTGLGGSNTAYAVV